jgi:hypothetical protein
VLLEPGAVTSLILSGLMCSLLILSTLLWGELARNAIRRSQQDAELKGHRLLEEWLSPQQRAQYQSSGSFEVTGSDSGTRYRIWRARQMNIEELDSDGKPAAIWCFLPEGRLPCGDVMLAQKLALENDEQAALAVAKQATARAPIEGVAPASAVNSRNG